MPCRQFRPLVVKYGEGDLPEDQTRLLDEHAGECASCRRSLALIDREDAAIASVLLPRRGVAVPGRPVRRLVRIFAAVLALLVLVLAALFVVYRGIGDRIDRGRDEGLESGTNPFGGRC